ncbi:hypothetical protein D3C81_1766290 [compost metagenome]
MFVSLCLRICLCDVSQIVFMGNHGEDKPQEISCDQNTGYNEAERSAIIFLKDMGL